MRRLLIVFLALAALWYYFIGGRRMDEEQIRTAYDRYWTAFYNDDRKAICDMFDKNFSSTATTKLPTGQTTRTVNQSEVCEGVKRFYEMKEAMEERLGRELFVNMEHTIERIEFAADRTSAHVDMSFEIRIGTENRLFMTITGTQADTVIRRMGRIRFLASEEDVSYY